MALLYRDFDKRVEIRSTRDGLMRVRRHADAVRYLEKHRDQPGLADALRRALAEHTRIEVSELTDDEVVEEAARRLLNGSLQLMELHDPRVRGRAALAQEAPDEGPIVVPAAAVLAPAVEAPAAPPLLPLLEEVQIEGAEVLPEIMQTLEQIDLVMGSIDTATVSLEPAPSGVPKITSAMQQASGSVTATLGAM